MLFIIAKSMSFTRFDPPDIISSVIKRPAMLAVVNETAHPVMKALSATLVIDGRLSGAKALKAPIMMPIDDGLANPQMAKVAIAADRGCKLIKLKI